MFFEYETESWELFGEPLLWQSPQPTTPPPPLNSEESLNPPLVDEYHHAPPPVSLYEAHIQPPRPATTPLMCRSKSRLVNSNSLASIFKGIKTLCDRLQLAPRIANEAQRIATRHALDRDSQSTYNQRIAAFTAAYLFVACRQERVPRSFAQISQAGGVSVRQLARRVQQIATKSVLGVHLQRAKAIDFLPRICAEAGFPFKYESAAKRLLLTCGVDESSQIAEAAGALHAVCGRESVATIAAVTSVCHRTVQRHCLALEMRKKSLQSSSENV